MNHDNCMNHVTEIVALATPPVGMRAVWSIKGGTSPLLFEPVISIASVREVCGDGKSVGSVGDDEIRYVCTDGSTLIVEYDSPSNFLGFSIPGDGREKDYWEKEAVKNIEIHSSKERAAQKAD